MPPFLKLDIEIFINKPALGKLFMVHEVTYKDKAKYKYGKNHCGEMASMFMYEVENSSHVLEQLPLFLYKKEIPKIHLFTIQSDSDGLELPIHVDGARRTAINIYQECNDETTYFYDSNSNVVGSFVARPGDIWMLDVSTPHSVSMRAAGCRTAITLSYRRTKFNDFVSNVWQI
jgi:hypothetical protein